MPQHAIFGKIATALAPLAQIYALNSEFRPLGGDSSLPALANPVGLPLGLTLRPTSVSLFKLQLAV